MAQYFARPDVITHTKHEVIKNERAEAIAKKLQVVERLREKQRAQTLKAKKDIIKAETDSWNEVTLQQHRTQQQLAKI